VAAAAAAQLLLMQPTFGHPSRCCRVRISALALLKMAMHAKSGGNIEVMGVMQVRRGSGGGAAGSGLRIQWCPRSLEAPVLPACLAPCRRHADCSVLHS